MDCRNFSYFLVNFLGLQLTKYQYHDFMMLLQNLEYMTRASQFRKYKAEHNLENLPNYQKRWKDLWKFAYDCVLMEEVMRRINNWSWTHMKEHINMCKTYRKIYKTKLSSKKIDANLQNNLNHYEMILDEVNIRIQRQLAERELESEKETESQGWFSSWWSSKPKEVEKDQKKLVEKVENALSPEEKEDLFEAIDYQENAHHGIYPKRFVAYKLAFE